MIRCPAHPVPTRHIPFGQNAVAGTAFSGKPIADMFIPPTQAGVNEKKTAAPVDFALSPVQVIEQENLQQWQARASLHHCKVVRVIERKNPAQNIGGFTDEGRCQAICSVHAFSALHNDPAIWDMYTNPADGQMGFAMLQRGARHVGQFGRDKVLEKQRQLAAQNATWPNTFRQCVGLKPHLNRDQRKELAEFLSEVLQGYRLTFVPGAKTMKPRNLGEQLDIARMVFQLPPGIHLLKTILASGESHLLSCHISGKTDVPSRLVDPNSCEWEGRQADLGRVLQDDWERHDLINRWCRGGRWVRMTYQ